MTKDIRVDDTQPPPDPANLVFLRRLVTALTAIMIVGVVAVVSLLVIRLQAHPPVLPEQIVLPDGVAARAVTIGVDWYAVVTDDDRILIFDRLSGGLRQEVVIDGP
ncbi:MAG: DUF6476 family protein [Pseudomonadota bacterium]